MEETRTGQTDLHEILFESLERLSNPDLTGDELRAEISRNKAICEVSGQIIQNGKLALDTVKFKVDYCTTKEVAQLPKFLNNDN